METRPPLPPFTPDTEQMFDEVLAEESLAAFEAPTAKCAIVLMTNDAITAGMPTVKKNGMIGMNPPMAVDTVADNRRPHGLGNVSSDSPSSSCTSVRRNCLGSFCRRSAMERASSAENPFSW